MLLEALYILGKKGAMCKIHTGLCLDIGKVRTVEPGFLNHLKLQRAGDQRAGPMLKLE